MSDSTTPRDDENPSEPTAPLWADPTAPMSQEPTSGAESGPGRETPAEQPAAPEAPAAPTPPPAMPPAPPSQGTAYPYGQQPGQGQSPYAAPQPGQPSPYPPQPGQAPYPPQQAYGQQQPYGQQPYWAQHGQPAPGTPGYYQNPAASPSNTSGIVLVIISALATLSTCVIGIPSLVLGIMALNANATDPVGSRRKSRTGWIVFGINVAVVVLLVAVFITIAVVAGNNNSNSFDGTY